MPNEPDNAAQDTAALAQAVDALAADVATAPAQAGSSLDGQVTSMMGGNEPGERLGSVPAKIVRRKADSAPPPDSGAIAAQGASADAPSPPAAGPPGTDDIRSLDAQLANLTEGLIEAEAPGLHGAAGSASDDPIEATRPKDWRELGETPTDALGGVVVPGSEGRDEPAPIVRMDPSGVVDQPGMGARIAGTGESVGPAPMAKIEAEAPREVAADAVVPPQPATEQAAAFVERGERKGQGEGAARGVRRVAGAVAPVAAKAAALAAPLTRGALRAASAPLANRPDTIRQSVAWIAVNTLFIAVVLWGYLLFVREPHAANAHAEPFDLRSSTLPRPAPPKREPSPEQSPGHGDAGKGHGATGPSKPASGGH